MLFFYYAKSILKKMGREKIGGEKRREGREQIVRFGKKRKMGGGMKSEYELMKEGQSTGVCD